jgi:hypothetical protein
VANLIWEYNNLVVSEPINLGALEHLSVTSEFEVKIRHDSDQEISGAGFYLSPYTERYEGSFSPIKDFERVMWLANNYPGYGLSIRQEYEVTGQIDGHDGVRIIDFERDERTDIFTGSQIEILSGPATGEIITISSYDPKTQKMTVASDFSADVKDANYKIVIDEEKFFKTGQGADFDTMIPLVYKGGVIERLDEAVIKLRLRIPKFAQSAGSFLFDFNMQFTSLEGS